MSGAFVAVSLLLAAGLSLCMLLLLLKSTTLGGRHHGRFRQGARVGGFTGIGLVLLLTLSAAGISDGSALVMAIISSPLSVVIGFLSGWGAVGAARIFEVFSGGAT